MNDKNTRFIKTVQLSYADAKKRKIDKKVNDVIRTIKENKGKVVSILSTVFGVGASTVYLIYTIIYEAEEEIPQGKFKTEDEEGNDD